MTSRGKLIATVTCGLLIAGIALLLLKVDEGTANIDTTLIASPPTTARALRANPSRSPEFAFKMRNTGRSLDFESASDLKLFLDEISQEAKNGDADAQWWSHKTFEYCKGFSRNPAQFSQGTESLAAGLPKDLALSFQNARNRVRNRCRNITPEETPSEATLLRMIEQSAKSGNLAAQASLISMDTRSEASDEDIRRVTERIRNTGDPQAYLAISSAMGIASSGRADVFGNVSGTDFATYAWQLAACRRGLDCGPNSAIMTSYCANGGICGRFTDLRDLVLNGLVPRQDAKRIEELTSRL